MITSVRLERFKNFHDATLKLGPLSIIVGTNASGKSNLRDAFRFIHGMARGYSFSEIIGDKYAEGQLIWNGIRGGISEIAEYGCETFSLKTVSNADLPQFENSPLGAVHDITISINNKLLGPRVVKESYYWILPELYDYDSHPTNDPINQSDISEEFIFVRCQRGGNNRRLGKKIQFVSSRAVLTQFVGNKSVTDEQQNYLRDYISETQSMRFLDLSPSMMRKPSFPGQNVLGDRGENLSSVLQGICQQESSKRAIMEWVRELTPIDVVDFEFIPDQTGRILVSLIDKQGNKTSAYSASDGTLRFLGMIAALLGQNAAGFYFLEEIDNGIHPTRLYLLLQLLEQFTKSGKIQVVATTHSPQLLGMLSPESREYASLVYREENSPVSQIKRIMDIPSIKDVLESQNLGRLHESGWLENVMAFTQPEEKTE